MKGLIVAYGERDSRGKDRLSEPRGLLKFGGKEVIRHTLDRFEEIGCVDETSLIIHPKNREQYEKSLGNDKRVRIAEYSGPSDPVFVYINAFKKIGPDSDILAVADDNLFDFSLSGLVECFNYAGTNVLAVRNIEFMPGCSGSDFGRCTFSDEGKVIEASYSFGPPKDIDSKWATLDIYLMHKKTISSLLEDVRNPSAYPQQMIDKYATDFHAWIKNDGFWADVGKPGMRREAERYFSAKHP